MIINLILNACQALSNREKAISVCSIYDEGQNTVLIKVRDQGSGIAEEHLARIIDPFFTTRYEAGGTGLGLYVSETIVEEHHGTLGFASEPGKGTEAIVTFPVEEG
ncbi:Sporulation kinase E [subsurface metagenome]